MLGGLLAGHRDGGKTWQPIRTPHGDSHDLWIAANNNQRMIEANDGGANISTNAGRTWTDQDYATAQFYHVTTTNHFPYHVCGAQQDNSTACLPSRPLPGSYLADFYDATGFSTVSTNAGSAGTLNEFEGMAGNDTVIGNGNTRVSYSFAREAVSVDLQSGTATGGASVGSDTFSGVNAVRGSNFDDVLTGSASNDTLEGLNGNDLLRGGAGSDVLNGGVVADLQSTPCAIQ